MENKKIDVLFGVVVIAFLLVTTIMIKEFNARRTSDYKEYMSTITGIVKQKNNKIRILSYQLAVKQKQIEDLTNTLSETRNDLDALSKKLAQPAPVAAPVGVPHAS